MKQCNRCMKEKPVTEFKKRKFASGNYGIRGTCRECIRDNDNIKYRTESEEKRSRRELMKRQWRSNNMEKIRALKKKYRLQKADFNCHVKEYFLFKKQQIKQQRFELKNIHDGHVKSYKINKKMIAGILSFKKSIENIGDRYVKRQLARGTNLKRKDLPFGLIEAKRQQLLITRYIRNANENS